VVETPRHLAGELDVGDLVLPHRHQAGSVGEDVRALEQRVAEETVGREVPLLQLLLLVLERRYPLEPPELILDSRDIKPKLIWHK
jgi:hypothetical protein